MLVKRRRNAGSVPAPLSRPCLMNEYINDPLYFYLDVWWRGWLQAAFWPLLWIFQVVSNDGANSIFGAFSIHKNFGSLMQRENVIDSRHVQSTITVVVFQLSYAQCRIFLHYGHRAPFTTLETRR